METMRTLAKPDMPENRLPFRICNPFGFFCEGPGKFSRMGAVLDFFGAF
jgi:hypothetical protein